MASSLVATGVQFPDNSIQTTAATSEFTSGTVMMFVQTAAPTGWTKSTTHNNKALRVVNGTVSPGGSTAFTSAFGTPPVSASVSVTGNVGATTLTTAQLASHSHAGRVQRDPSNQGPGPLGIVGTNETTANANGTTQNTGSNSSHTHSFSGSGSLSSATATINVQYVDVIIATKD
jgi:hypothetical protein